MSAPLPRFGLLALLDEDAPAVPSLPVPAPFVPRFRAVESPCRDPLAPKDAALAGARPTIATLAHHHCRWPMGEASDPAMQYCGAPRLPGGSWCAEHAVRARSRHAATGSIDAADLSLPDLRMARGRW